MVELTIGSYSYFSYTTVDDADEYLSASLSATDWSELDADTKARVLVMTTRYLDTFKWKGTKADEAQSLEWPRVNTGVPPSDDAAYNRFYNGFLELSALVAADNSLLLQANSGSNVQRAKGGESEVWFFKSTLETASVFPPLVHQWLKVLLAGSEGGSLTFVSGVDDCFDSVFDEPPTRHGGLY